MFKNYVITAWRSIAKNKLYSIINITGLGIGLAICMLITLFVKDEFSFDRFQKNRNKIYRLVVNETSTAGEKFKYGVTGMVHGEAFQKQIPGLQKMVRISGTKLNIKYGNDVLVQDANYTDSSFFDVFPEEFIEGSPHKALSGPSNIVISEKAAKLFFGNNKALGRVLSVEKDSSFKNYTITGVTKNSPLNSSIQLNILLPFDYKNNRDQSWINFYLNTFFIVKEGADIGVIEKQIASVFKTAAQTELVNAKKDWNYDNQLVFGLQPFLDMHLSRDYKSQNGLKDSGNPLLSYILAGLALFILLIACINFVNISISHSLQRAKEIGVRKVMGGSRRQLIMQFMSEAFLLNAGAFILAVVFTILWLPVFNSFTSKALSFSYLLDTKLVLIFLFIFLLTGLLAGFYPALVLSGYKPVQILYGKFRLSGKNLLQRSLIVFQFGLASFFIVLAIIQYKQVDLFTGKDLGYDDRNMLVISTAGAYSGKGKIFIEEIKKNKEIISVAPRNAEAWVTIVNIDNGEQMGPDMNVVDENYIPTLGLQLKEGRAFSKDFPADSTLSVMVNEAFVKEAGWKTAIGQNVKVMNRDPYKVIGVVKDYHFSSLYEKVRPQVFTCNNNYGGYGSFYIKLSGLNTPATLDFVRSTFRQLFPTKPYTYNFLADINSRQYEKEFQMKQIIFWSALIIIFISCMGLFGLSILTAEKRKKEIGVRKVLGAKLSAIVQLLSLDFMKLVMLGFIIFTPIAWYTGKSLLQNYPYRTHIGAGIFAATFLGLVVISLLTVSYHTLRAAMANPVKSLRTE
ncbi:MAG: ABC transporter permease [Ferruginibacter sp.]